MFVNFSLWSFLFLLNYTSVSSLRSQWEFQTFSYACSSEISRSEMLIYHNILFLVCVCRHLGGKCNMMKKNWQRDRNLAHVLGMWPTPEVRKVEWVFFVYIRLVTDHHQIHSLDIVWFVVIPQWQDITPALIVMNQTIIPVEKHSS